MHRMITFTITFAVILVLVKAGPIKYYATKYDHLDIEQILNNRRMVNYYAQCLLSKGPCPPQGVEFKRILPEALETNCLRCTEKQKVVTYRTIKRLKKEYPKVWEQLSAKWDPDDIYVRKFEETYKNTSPLEQPMSSENEINLDDRFGVIETKKPIPVPTAPPMTTRYTTTTTHLTAPPTNTIHNTYYKVENETKSTTPTTPAVVNIASTTTERAVKSTTKNRQSDDVISVVITEKPVVSTSTRRSDDVISIVLSNFLNPPNARLTIVRNNNAKRINTTPATLPFLQNFFFSNNNNISSNNPVGNFVRGITSVGGQLLETGSSIADTVLTSFRSLINPAPRRV